MLRLSEHYTSIQGEGPRTGVLTQFVRFAGCNMRCPGWPCDTPFAIDPAIWRHESEKVDPHELFKRVVREAETTGATNVCLTGGEPYQQPSADFQHFQTKLRNLVMGVEIFTNGSFPIKRATGVRIMMDWKLQGSGEAGTEIQMRRANLLALRSADGVKFVVKDEQDLSEAVAVYTEFKAHMRSSPQFWVGAAWDTISDDAIVQFLKDNQLPWRLNVQVHKYIWPATARRT